MINTLKARLKFYIIMFVTLVSIVIIIDNATTVLRIAYPVKYKEYVYKYSSRYGVDPYLVFAIIKAESSFDPNATSHRNAIGLMQITERTGAWGARDLKMGKFEAADLYDPETNIEIGCWYIGRLMKQFNNNLELVITAYNSGSGRVSEWLRDQSYSNSGDNLEKIPFKETDKYLKRVKNYHSVYKSLYGKSF